MKYKNYLVRMAKAGESLFLLGRGNEVEGYSDLAIVRIASERNPLVFDGGYAIIDIASGLFVVSANKKSNCLDKFNYRLINNDLERRIIEARKGEKYLHRVFEANEERKVWRKSGYEI